VQQKTLIVLQDLAPKKKEKRKRLKQKKEDATTGYFY
jgi:hypothetical protein